MEVATGFERATAVFRQEFEGIGWRDQRRKDFVVSDNALTLNIAVQSRLNSNTQRRSST